MKRSKENLYFPFDIQCYRKLCITDQRFSTYRLKSNSEFTSY